MVEMHWQMVDDRYRKHHVVHETFEQHNDREAGYLLIFHVIPFVIIWAVLLAPALAIAIAFKNQFVALILVIATFFITFRIKNWLARKLLPAIGRAFKRLAGMQ